MNDLYKPAKIEPDELPSVFEGDTEPSLNPGDIHFQKTTLPPDRKNMNNFKKVLTGIKDAAIDVFLPRYGQRLFGFAEDLFDDGKLNNSNTRAKKDSYSITKMIFTAVFFAAMVALLATGVLGKDEVFELIDLFLEAN